MKVKNLTNMPEEHRTFKYSDSCKSKMESWQFLPLQSRTDKQKNYLERVSKEIESKRKKRREILQKWIETDQELEAVSAKQMQAKQMALLVTKQSAHFGTSLNKLYNTPLFKSVLSMQSMVWHLKTAHGGWRNQGGCSENQSGYGTDCADIGDRDRALGREAHMRSGGLGRRVLQWNMHTWIKEDFVKRRITEKRRGLQLPVSEATDSLRAWTGLATSWPGAGS